MNRTEKRLKAILESSDNELASWSTELIETIPLTKNVMQKASLRTTLEAVQTEIRQRAVVKPMTTDYLKSWLAGLRASLTGEMQKSQWVRSYSMIGDWKASIGQIERELKRRENS
jgi:hypothetical protein